VIQRSLLFVVRLERAWRYYRCLHYSWRLAWHKAGNVYAELAR
jgi:hypothetical protein